MSEALWLEYASRAPGRPPLCGLCGNTGIVDTRGKVRSPAGVECGVRAWCLCPNGRGWKRRGGKPGEVNP
jgi:hypothetical protein